MHTNHDSGPVRGPCERGRHAVRIAKDRAGLVVHYDCGDGELTAALGRHKGVIVQGLTRRCRSGFAGTKRIHASGLSGPVSIRLWTTKRLPYADNVVNVLIASSPIKSQEVTRVLAPGGMLLTRRAAHDLPANLKAVDSSGGWQSFIKPVPAEMDEWTHYLHAANNNAVANDSLIGPPRHLRWNGGPKYSRNHEIDSSVVSAVTGGGRLFYVVDEGSSWNHGSVPATEMGADRTRRVQWRHPLATAGTEHGMADLETQYQRNRLGEQTWGLPAPPDPDHAAAAACRRG